MPFGPGVGATSTGSAVESQHILRNVERLVGQAHTFLGLTNAIVGQRVAVYRRGVDVGGRMAYVAPEDDQ